MANYAQISTGSYNYDDTKKAQELLNTHGYGLDTDGIFGPKTEAAVRNYQTAKGLQSDGIIGKNTWASLLSGSNSAPQQPAAPDNSAYTYDPTQNQAFSQHQQAMDQTLSQIEALKNPYDEYAQTLKGLAEDYANRDPFSYDPTTDPMYQQYKDLYTRQGQLAMMDTMGQAAALTGGYGSSYSHAAGQQAYQGYLQQLGERLPEFYGMALDRYNAQSEALLNQYSLTGDLAQNAYNQYKDSLGNLWQTMDYHNTQADNAYDRDFNAWYTAQQLGASQRSDSYNRLAELISLGYDPTDADLTAAGMTRAQAKTLTDYY